jgi:hypothetical protein
MKWIKCSERLPEKNRRVICGIYGTDIIRVAGGETLEDAVERTMREVRCAEIGFVDEKGYWCNDDGFPMVVKPLIWKSLPILPSYEAVKDDDI